MCISFKEFNEMQTNKNEILNSYITNKCSSDEKNKIKRWLSTDEGQKHLSEMMDGDIAQTLNGEEILIDHQVRSENIFLKINNKINRQITLKKWIQIAAVIVPLLILNISLWYYLPSETTTITPAFSEIYVPKGERLNVLLQDGTRIWLNSDSKLSYAYGGGMNNSRYVKLEGEAYFEVSKQENNPFIVELNNMQIRVLGTSFNVNAYPEKEEIITTLKSGHVEIIDQTFSKNKTYDLAPNMTASFSKYDGICKIETENNIEHHSLWMKNKIVFNNTPLSEVLSQLSRTYNIEYEIQNKHLTKYTFTVKFENASLDDIITSLQRISPIKIKKDGSKIKVYTN